MRYIARKRKDFRTYAYVVDCGKITYEGSLICDDIGETVGQELNSIFAFLSSAFPDSICISINEL